MKLGIRLTLVALFSCVFLFSSCDTDEDQTGITSTVNIRFRALADGQPYEMNERIMLGGKEIVISNLRFFISDLVLLKGTLEAEVKDLDFVNFTENNTNSTAANQGITIYNGDVSIGAYDGVKFGIGVPSDLNAQTPSDFSPSHPLSIEHWTSWDSYIFHKIEGRYDNDEDPTTLDGSFVYHVGLDEYFREKVFNNLDIIVRDGETTEIVVDLEIMDLLKNEDGSTFNFPEIGSIHSEESDGEYTNIIANNWVKSFSLQ
ncbi:MAG: hypothetical protein ACI94Y_004500 [Maribacter sp.]|jgi:hypothetical protein